MRNIGVRVGQGDDVAIGANRIGDVWRHRSIGVDQNALGVVDDG